METSSRTDLLSRWALEAGFDRAGTALLEPLPAGSRFLDWLASRRQAEMRYMARRVEARLDPRQLFPGARSVVCVALQYAGSAGGDTAATDLWEGVARYARGVDYHDLMVARLRALAQRVEGGFPGATTRWYVDTGPVLERELAAQCGLGVPGKNTCLLDADAGSWFFIGELFTSLELETTAARQSDLCGSCTRCLEACPTDALVAPYELDSSRCISYWTIEHRGEIPHAMRPQLGEWVFGCDICQEVCPHNADLDLRVDEGLQPDVGRDSLTLAGLLALSRQEYTESFRGSPMKRAKLDGLQRNAIVAMGNRGRSEDVGLLGQVLQSGSTLLRRHAAWALGSIGGPAAAEHLDQAWERETEAEVLRELEIARQAVPDR